MSSLSSWKALQKNALKLTSNNIKTLYFKDGLLAIYKPYGIPVHAGPKMKRSMLDLFPGLEQRYKLPAGSLELANRLDKNVAGVLLLTYEKNMAAHIAQLQRSRLIEKSYLAILVGNTSRVSGILKGGVIEDVVRKHYKQTIANEMHSNQTAETEFQILDNNEKSCLLCLLHAKTGYKHQIRVHMSELMDTPILGDHKYHPGEPGPQPLPLRLMQLLRMEGVKSDDRKSGKIRPWQRALVPLHLFAHKILIPDLDSGKHLKIKADVPGYFRDTMLKCDLMLNREEYEEKTAKRKLKFTRGEIRASVLEPKGISSKNTGQETTL